METIYEEKARAVKAHQLAEVFMSQNATPAQVAKLDDAGWRAAEQLAGVLPASLLTREAVVEHVAVSVRLAAKLLAAVPGEGY